MCMQKATLRVRKMGILGLNILYAMNLLEDGNKNAALDWLAIAAAQGHLKSSLWIEQNTDYQKDKIMKITY